MALSTGLISGDRHLSQADLQDEVARAAAGFKALGIKPGDTVALLLRNDFAFLVTIFAANRLGAYAVPINWHFKPAEVRYILEDSHSTILVGHTDLLAPCMSDLPAGLTVISVDVPDELRAAYHADPSIRIAGTTNWRHGSPLRRPIWQHRSPRRVRSSTRRARRANRRAFAAHRRHRPRSRDRRAW